MTGFALPALYAVLAWWFATGLILILDGLPRTTFRWSLSAATVVLLAAAYEINASCRDASSGGAYAAFLCAILVWGWIEMSFLMGFITGPRKHGCRDRCAGWRHFVHATQAIFYNEIATLLGGAGIVLITWHAPNRVAAGTYLVLWVMRLSAKLNLFLGVPNLGENLLPEHLRYLKSFFRRRSMNVLFPLSITGSTVALCLLGLRYSAAADGFASTAYALLSSLLALAVLEHWFMMLPVPSDALWKWATRSSRATTSNRAPIKQPIPAKVP